MVGGWGVDRHWVRPFLINLSALVSASISCTQLTPCTHYTQTHMLYQIHTCTYSLWLIFTHICVRQTTSSRAFRRCFFQTVQLMLLLIVLSTRCGHKSMKHQLFFTFSVLIWTFLSFFFFRLLNFCLLQEMCIFNKHKNRLRDMLVSEPTITWMCCK